MKKNLELENKKLQIALCAGMLEYLSDILDSEVEYEPEVEVEDECVLEECEDGSYIYYPDWEDAERLTAKDVFTDAQMRGG